VLDESIGNGFESTSAQLLEGRESPAEITLFKSLGIIDEDLTAARYAMTRAIAENRGARVPFE
jgi:ornithine cyclodeaminase/alanine dehydrogenase-like protein (mu-crystallin family)